MVKHWAYDSFFYHIYPLGFCGAPEENDFEAPITNRLNKLYDWLEHLNYLGVNALYLGPLFESTAHGYDTVDYYQVDRRLGDNELLADLVTTCHQREIKVILDGVFHHVGRDFWAFKDVLTNGQESDYCDWFSGLDFDYQSPYGDPFTYDAWEGHYDLVKLNLNNPEVKNYLLEAVELWIEEFDIDGLRLDAADCLDRDFIKELVQFCKDIKSDFWLMGEIIHGDYSSWAGEEMLDSVTNYECYKGLYSSHNDQNYYEIAYSLDRQFGVDGIYKHLPLYSFVDNHDVDRIASTLDKQSYLAPIYILLLTIPGVPSIYYGSEWGIKGEKNNGNDQALRPELNLKDMFTASGQQDLVRMISRLARIRQESQALRYGNYRELSVADQQFAFLRETDEESVVVVVNNADEAVEVDISLEQGEQLIDLLNHGDQFKIEEGKVEINEISPYWARIMRVE